MTLILLENRTKLPSGNTCHLEMNRFIYRLINLYKVLKKRHQHGVSVTYGNRNEQIHFTNGIVMQFARAQIEIGNRKINTQVYQD